MAEDWQPACRPGDRVSLDPNSRLYPRLLGPAWASLHPAVQRVHTVPRAVRAHAQFEVRRPPGRLLGLLLDLAAVPAAASDTAVQLAIVERATPHGPRELWHRVFEGRPLGTLQQEAPGGLLSERAGPLEFRFRLRVEDGAMLFEQQGCWFRFGTMRLRVPRWLAPTVWCREGATDRADQTRVYVKVTAPSGGLLFSYQGTVTWNVTQVTR